MAGYERAQVDGALLAYTTHGPEDGRPVVLVHAGIVDRHLWALVLRQLPEGVRAIAYDARGFGNSTWRPGRWSAHQDLLALLDALGLERADLVGSSAGAHTALEVAAVAPERVASVIALAPPLPDHDWSADLEAYGDAEEAALTAGRIDTAVELNLRTWVDGPHRTAAQSDPEHRRGVKEALAHALEAQQRNPLGVETELDPPVSQRLDAITADVAVAVGDLDQPDFVAIASRLVAGLPRASLHRVAGAGHLLPLERPDVVARLIAGLGD